MARGEPPSRNAQQVQPSKLLQWRQGAKSRRGCLILMTPRRCCAGWLPRLLLFWGRAVKLGRGLGTYPSQPPPMYDDAQRICFMGGEKGRVLTDYEYRRRPTSPLRGKAANRRHTMCWARTGGSWKSQKGGTAAASAGEWERGKTGVWRVLDGLGRALIIGRLEGDDPARAFILCSRT